MTGFEVIQLAAGTFLIGIAVGLSISEVLQRQERREVQNLLRSLGEDE